MFFILSKLFTYFLYPFTWGLTLMGWSVFAKNNTRSKKLIVSAFLVFYIFSNQFIFDVFVHWWEPKITPIDNIHQTYEVGIVLGGMSFFDKTNKTIHPQRSFDRLLQAVRLYRAGKIKKIFISGGGVTILNDSFPESYYLIQYLNDFQIPDSVVFYETISRNTHENAIETAKQFNAHHWSKKHCLLITTATHLPRAKRCYEKAGFSSLSIFPTDSYSKYYDFKNMAYWVVPNAEILFNWQSLIKEWVGLVVYRIMGYA